MNYIKIGVDSCNEEQKEIITAMLSDWPFESFSEEEATLCAFIKDSDFTPNRSSIEAYLNQCGHKYTIETIEQVNWNALWESNFEPIRVEERCIIRAPFHPIDPTFEYDIEIMPKMSFGTGHHATTYLMIAEIMDGSWSGLHGLDMGSGTGVLSIMAAKMGAKNIDAVDIDEWAYENAHENITSNNVASQIVPILGDATAIKDKSYDFILANINRNILLADMGRYVESLKKDGILIVSGILEVDTHIIIQYAQSLNLKAVNCRTRDGWAEIRFAK